MKEYTFELVVKEGNDEFWEGLEGKTGCDEVKELIIDAMSENGMIVGIDYNVELTQYSSK